MINLLLMSIAGVKGHTNLRSIEKKTSHTCPFQQNEPVTLSESLIKVTEKVLYHHHHTPTRRVIRLSLQCMLRKLSGMKYELGLFLFVFLLTAIKSQRWSTTVCLVLWVLFKGCIVAINKRELLYQQDTVSVSSSTREPNHSSVWQIGLLHPFLVLWCLPSGRSVGMNVSSTP